MKTNHSFISKINYGMSALILLTGICLLITSCQKEELQQPSAYNSSSQGSTMNDQAKELPAMAFTSIKIDHIAANTSLPDYSITINSNGTAAYDGRRNVRVKGKVKLSISIEQLSYINSVCNRTNFFQLKGSEHQIFDMPSVETTYVIWKRQLALSDYNGQPEELASFRNKIEKTLDISNLINTSSYIASPLMD